MKKILHTLSAYSSHIVFRYIMPCVIIATIICIIWLLVSRKKEKSTLSVLDYINNNINTKLIGYWLLITYSIMPLWSAVLIRIKDARQEPLSDILGGWLPMTHQYTYNFDFVINLLIFAPFCIVLYLFAKLTKSDKPNLNNIAKASILISAFYSAIIELLQIVLRVGTFQISDLVYNILGAAISSIITIKIIEKVKSPHPKKHKNKKH